MKDFRSAALFLCVLMAAGSQLAPAQFRADAQRESFPPEGLTGHLRTDLLAGVGLLGREDSLLAGERAEVKSPLRAALYSAVIPGAGDVYAESYWTAAAFFTLEVGLWVFHLSYENKGDNQTKAFEAFADEHWRVDYYAQWIETWATTLNPNATGCTGLIVNPGAANPWDRVDWVRLNQCEESIGAVPSTGFSHRLPRRPDQQYYEMIGKYEQYNPGWDDAYGVVTPDDYLTNVSANFRAYRDMRGEANSFYTTARTASYLLVANHVLAALHSAWRAAQFNRELTVGAHLEPIQRQGGLVELVPTASFKLAL